MKQERENSETKIRALSTNHLLRNLGEEKLERILAISEEEIWPKKTCNISKSRIYNRFYFILSGRLKMYLIDFHSGREFTLCLLKKDDVFDVIRLVDGSAHEVFFETIDRVHLLSLPLQVMLQLLEELPQINKNLLPYLTAQIKCLEDYAANLTLSDIPKRLARLLLGKVNPRTKELETIHDLSNEELASLIGSTRAVVNRQLQEFKSEGILSLDRKNMRVKDLQLLLYKAYPALDNK